MAYRGGEPLTILADTSGLLVLLDADHALHPAARELMGREGLVVPSTVLPEVDYMAVKYLGVATARTFLEDVAEGAYDYLQVERTDIVRARQIVAKYRDVYVGFVDASLLAVAERYQIRRILTLDRRHFAMFRPKGLDYLELLP
ncbi:MAG: PIN domain-containing protein [Dethiobacter sp.]|nr:PIN domain-containing protein [Dethiobacter sp.]